jgi:hypothetical protein
MVKATTNGGDPPAPVQRPLCGIVMPISAVDGCSEVHWAEVLDIVQAAADAAGFEANLVSSADDVGIIQKRIIQNLYDNPIVLCDVSGRNPNVMFELGLRLAFDKPTLIIKDDKTSYAFDTSPIEHLEYPRDLRFARIVEFKERLAEKIQATHQKAQTDKHYTTFRKHFGEFKVAAVDTKEVSSQEFLLEEIKEIKAMLRNFRLRDRISLANRTKSTMTAPKWISLRINGIDDNERNRILAYLKHSAPPEAFFHEYDVDKDEWVIRLLERSDVDIMSILNRMTNAIKQFAPGADVSIETSGNL